MSTIQYITLSQLSSEIEGALKKQLERTYWIVAEISECSINYSGHCYLELIEKPEQSDAIVAKTRATIWAQTYRLISAYFKTATGIDLQAGIKVLLQVTVEYHTVYGLSVNIKDIDPTYTLGEDEKQRREILERLEFEGIIDMNAELDLAEVPQKLAIISSPKAAGFQDFMNQLLHNEFGIVFYTKLFPAAMQGGDVETDIIRALDEIYAFEDCFDAVVIIRGGGAKADLRWFDNYNLAAHLAQFPLPVISGIGHDKDQSIVDIVAHTSLKTPTAVADFFIARASEVLGEIQQLEEQLRICVDDYIFIERKKVEDLSYDLSAITQKKFHSEYFMLQDFANSIANSGMYILSENRYKLDKLGVLLKTKLRTQVSLEAQKLEQYSNTLQNSSQNILQNQQHLLELLLTKLQMNNPQNILDKGYSVTTNASGKVIKSFEDAVTGDEIWTRLANGRIVSKVLK